MAFDPRLILGHQQYTGPDPHQTMRTLADLAGRRTQQQVAHASLADMLHKRQQEASLADVYRQSADSMGGGLPSALARGGFGSEAIAARGQQAELEARRAQSQKAMQEALKARTELFARALGSGVKSQADLDQVLVAARASGLSDVELTGLDTYNEQTAPIFERLVSMGVPTEKRAQFDATASEAEKRRAFDAGEKTKDRTAAQRRAETLAGTQAAAREAVATRGTTVPGLEIIEGAAPTAEDAKKVKASQASLKRMTAYAKELRALHEKHGTELVGPHATRMEQLVTQLQLEGKNIGELGALSGPDLGLMQSIIGTDPASLKSNAKSLLGMDNAGAALDGLGQWAEDQERAILDSYGYRRPAPDPKAARPTGSFDLEDSGEGPKPTGRRKKARDGTMWEELSDGTARQVK